MPRIRRWHPVSHDLVRDREFQALLEIHPRAGYVWIEMLSEADRNEGKIAGDVEQIVRGYAWVLSPKTPKWGEVPLRKCLSFMEVSGWLLRGIDHFLVRNYPTFHPRREQASSPPVLTNSLTNKQVLKALSGSNHPTPTTKAQAREILEFLNLKTGRTYRAVATNLNLIEARLKSGATPENCRGIIVRKVREWGSDPKMKDFLRPATLFNATKFEQYLGEKPHEDMPGV